MKTKRPILITILIILLSAGVGALVVGCNNNPTSVSEPVSTLKKVTDSKTIHALYLVYPPTVQVDKDANKPSGFLVDVMNEIATRAGWKIEYSPTTFDDMKLAISSPNYDVIVGAIFVNVPRAKEMNFTSPVLFWQGTLGITTTAKAASFTTWDDVDKPGIKIAASSGTAEYDYVKQHIQHATINGIPNSDLTLTLSEVTSGRADVAFGDAVTVKKFIQQHPEVSLIMGGKQFNGFAAGFAVKQSDAAWNTFLNESLLALQVDGTIDNLSHKWGGENIWLLPKRPWE